MYTTSQLPSARRAWITAVCATAIAILGLAFSAVQAQAGIGYAFTTSFDIGQATNGHPQAVAVDTSTNPNDPSAGDVYVTDGKIVNKFTAAHAAEGDSTPDGQLTGFVGAASVAVDPANGDVYVLEGNEAVGYGGEVRKFTPQGSEISFSLTGASFVHSPQGVAVDPTDGDVYVAEGAFTVDQFNSSGEFTGRQYSSTSEAESRGFAVSGNGTLYVAGGDSGMWSFAASCPSPCSTHQILDSEISRDVAVNPATEDVFAAQETFETGESLVELQPNGNPVGVPFGLAQAAAPNLLVGLALNGSGTALYAVNQEGDEVDLFTAGPTPEEPVVAEAATGVTAMTATLNGELVGGETGYYFAYNVGASCTGGLTTTPGKATGKTKVSVEVTGLQPDVQYAFCLVATNKYGQAEGSNSFSTPAAQPSVDSESVSSLAQTTATLEALVNPNNQASTCLRFEYIDDAGYQAAIAASAANPYSAGASAPCEPSSLGSAYGDQRVTAKIKGLADATAYHFRVVVSNATSPGGETDGPDAEFKTQQPAPAVATGAELTVTQTTATVTGTVNPELLSTVYFYEYGPSAVYGPATSRVPAGEGATPATATEFLGSLVPGTTYHYRLVAINEDGTTYGEDRQFTTLAYTPPSVVTGAASAGSPNAATLSGTVDPQGIPTTYEFQVGTDTNYGARIFALAGESSEPQAETLAIAGLQAGTTYHFRICATNEANAGDPACGTDATFTTPVVPLALVQPGTLPFLTTPAVAFPVETKTTTPKALTNAQKLAAALKVCKRDKVKKRRVGCEAQARKKYAPAKKKGKPKK